MKVTSEQFKTKAENQYGAVYKIRALVDGAEITDEIQDFEYSAMTNPDGEFTFGNTCASQISFKIDTPSQNLTDREITIQQGIDIDGVVEYVNIGVFKVLKPENSRSVYTYQCVDRMVSRMEMPYFSELTYPATDIDILEEICNQVNISLDNADSLIPHTLQSAPSGYTRREIIGYMAQLQGKNAIINGNGNLELKWYNNVDYTIDDDRIYLDGSDSIKDETNYILGYIECSVSTSSDEEIKTIKSGTGNIGIKIENPFMTQEILDEVFSVIGGFTFMPLEVQFLGDFRLEVGDIVTVETYGKTYQVPIMQLTHSSDGGVVTTIESIAETDSENEISFTNPITKQMERYYAELVLINKALVNKLGVEELDAAKAEITTLVVGEIDGRYANIDMANVSVADIGILFNRVGLIDRATIVDGHITGFLDAVEINANKITSGTLVTDRLLLSGKEGSVLFELNNLGELTSTNVDSLDGYVLTDRTIHADKLIANSITANELDVTNIFGNTAVLRTIVSQDIFSDAIATHTMVVGAYEYAEEAVNLSKSTNIAQGSPIYINDSADGSVIEFGAYGRSEQKQYSGKNLCNIGTKTGTLSLEIPIDYLADGDYTISCILTSTDTDTSVCAMYKDSTFLVSASRNTRIAKAFTKNAGDAIIRIYASSAYANSTGDTLTISDIQIETGNTMTEYEPYVGGTASPNPDYPQEIKSVGECGYFDGELLQGDYDASTGIYNSSNAKYVCSKNPMPCTTGDTVNLVYEEFARVLAFIFYDKDMKFISANQKATSNTLSATVPDNAKYMHINVSIIDGNISPATAKKIVVTVNDKYAVKVKSTGKNLFELGDTTNDYYLMSDGGGISYDGWVISKYIVCKPNTTYTLSGGTEYANNASVCWYDSNKNYIGGKSYSNKSSVTITTSSNATYIRVSCRDDMLSSFQIEMGTEVTPYEQYKESITYIPINEPLRSSLDESAKDEIACVDGTYGVVRRFKEVVFDGSDDESWSDVSGNAPFAITLNNLKETISHDLAPNLFCSHYTPIARTASWVNYDYLVSYSDNGLIRFRNVDVATLSDFKASLVDNSITVVYELTTPVFEPFEDQSIFDNIVTFNHITTISATDNPDMWVKYYRNSENGEQFANLSDVNKKAEEALSEVGATVKSITIHYLATSAGSGVTTSTSGWTATVQNITSDKKYLWTYQTITYVDGNTTDTTPVISGVYGAKGDKGDTGATGATGTGVSKVTPLYYLKSNTTAPSAPTSAVTSTSTSSGVWTTAIPTYVSGYTYFACTQTLYSNGSYSWSTVVADNAFTEANKVATTANSTANTANTNATNAVNTANTASTNATNALDRATYRYGTCSTAAGTSAKVVSLSGFKLYTGAQITVLFTYANTVANPTLNVNSTGAKAIRVNGANITSKYYWYANNTVTFTYDGTYWVMSDTSANTILANWASSNDITYIDGGKIYTGSITADKISVDSLSAITADLGTITGGYLKSANFAMSGTDITSGMYIDLNNGIFESTSVYIGDNVARIGNLEMKYFAEHAPSYFAISSDDDIRINTARSETSNVSEIQLLTDKIGELPAVVMTCGDSKISVTPLANTLISSMTNVIGELNVSGATTLESTLDVTGNTTIGGSLQISGDGLELIHATPFIDFHYNKSTADYTSRIIESSSGHLDIKASNGITATGYIKNTGANIILGTNNKFLYGVSTSNAEYALIGLNSSNQCDVAPTLANVVIGKAATSLTIGKSGSLTTFGGRIQTGGGIEIDSTSPYIDFHYNNDTADYNVRLINNEDGKLHCLGHYAPTADNTYQLGYAGKRWKQLYANTSTISTSDRNLKYDFKEFDERYDTLYDLLKPYSFKLIYGDSGRSHSGFVSQDVEEALQLAGLTALDFAGFCKDIKQKSVVVTPAEYDENGNIISEAFYESVDDLDENGNLQYTYSLRYEEFIALNTNQIQKLKTRVNILEEENRELKETINNILLRLQVLEERG